MSLHRSALALVLVSFAAVACTSTAEDSAEQSDQEVTGAVGEANGFCGGIAGIRCKAGLKCKLAGSYPDASGKCESDAPVFTCMAMPTCREGDTSLSTPCAAGDASCYTESLCGKTVSCKKAEAEAVIEGELYASFGIGGENTGTSIKSDTARLELVLDAKEQAQFVDGRFARATGKRTTLSGVETQNRPALDVSELLVCPAPGASVNCMPPVSPSNTLCGANRAWVSAKCKDVQYLD